jgi:DNA phosphorothioation-dependent restriction protein DptG
MSAIEAMQQIVGYGIMQFAEGTGRFRVQTQYMDVFDKGVAKSFIQARGRAGKVLVVNQDFVLLLTNLSIGYRKSLRFQELLAEFRSRGFWFDKSSQQALISFYERVGNVDRMSDSGDAVYVRNTI